MLNCLVLLGLGSSEVISPRAGAIFGWVALVPATTIFLFSHREGGIGARLGMGAYNLFSTVFYLGDVLSYLRLMALGLATAGVAMAVNIIAQTAGDVPYVGFIIAALLIVGGHLFNAAMSSLGAFVHTMRLQFVEFFPKFLVGGGTEFQPLTREYKHVYINREGNEQ
jgi:V/A-type H+-transporting ATPase subunit I